MEDFSDVKEALNLLLKQNKEILDKVASLDVRISSLEDKRSRRNTLEEQQLSMLQAENANSSSSTDEHHSTPLRSNRRSTIAVQDSATGYVAAERTDTIIVQNAPKFDIFLERPYVKNIILLKRAIYKYEREYNRKVILPLQIAEGLKQRLINDHTPTSSIEEFDALDNDTIWKYLRSTALPKNIHEWVMILKTSAVFPKLSINYIPSITNFNVLYDAILTYGRDFLEVYDYLAKADRKMIPALYAPRKVPGTHSKEDSLIGLYLGAMPGEIGKHLHTLLIDQERPNSLKEYVDTFNTGLKAYHDKTTELRVLCGYINDLRKKLNPNPSGPSISMLTHTSEAHDHGVHDCYADSPSTPNINALTTAGPTKPSEDAGVCYAKLFGKPCPNGVNCKYSHDVERLDKARLKHLDFMKQVKYKADSPLLLQRPKSVPHRPPPSIPLRSQHPSKLSAIQHGELSQEAHHPEQEGDMPFYDDDDPLTDDFDYQTYF